MKIKFTDFFNKELAQLKNKNLAKVIAKTILIVEQTKSITDIPNIKKLKGHKTAYRIRSGNYRIGVFIENDTVIFSVFDHRKDIYKHFPK